MQRRERESAAAAAAAAAEEDEMQVQAWPSSDDNGACWATYGGRSGRRKLPPPIPGLAVSARLACRSPWALQRIYEDDGDGRRRLVIHEVQGERHEYLKARRGDGRLTLHRMEWVSAAAAASVNLGDDIQKIEVRKARGADVVVGEYAGDLNLKNETSAPSPSSTSLLYEDDGRSNKGSACPREELKRVHQHMPPLSIPSAWCNV